MDLVDKYPDKPWNWGEFGLSDNPNITIEIINKYPSFSKAYLNLSDLYMQKLMAKEAKEILYDGIKLFPNIPELYVNLGMACRSLGQISEAKKYLIKALSINKNLFKCSHNFLTTRLNLYYIKLNHF